MGQVKTMKGDDGKPYISLEDFINEVKKVKNSQNDPKPSFLDVVLKTLENMEEEYYNKAVFKKDDFNDED